MKPANLTAKQEFIAQFERLGGQVTQHGPNLTILFPGLAGKRKCCEILGTRIEGDIYANYTTKRACYAYLLGLATNNT